MKKAFLTIILTATIGVVSAQTDSTVAETKMAIPTFGFDPPPTSISMYTDSSLNLMTKMKLTEIYLGQVQQLAMSIPYTPFTLEVPDSSLGKLDIPDSKYIQRKRDAVRETSVNYGEVIRERLYEVVPYSDKKDIIRSILYLQTVIETIKQIK